MDTWMKIVSAVTLGLMLVFLLPRAKQIMNDTPPAQRGDWRAALLPIAVVIVFVLLLMNLTR